jgi:hypothetical protein
MNLQFAVFAVTTIITAASASAPDFSGLPNCAIQFLTAVCSPSLYLPLHAHIDIYQAKDAFPESDCSLTDPACFCSNGKLVAAFQASVTTTCNAYDQVQASQALQSVCSDIYSAQPIPNYTAIPSPQSTPSTTTPYNPDDYTTTLTTTLPQTTISTTNTPSNTEISMNLDTRTPTFPTVSTTANTTTSMQSLNTSKPTAKTTTSHSSAKGESAVLGKELLGAAVVGMAFMTFVFAEF